MKAYPSNLRSLRYYASLWVKILCLIILNIVSLSPHLYAQKNPIKFDCLTIEHGLSNNSVPGIVQDDKGFMWFGTYDGLNRYDGYDFKVYQHNPADPNSLSSN